MAEESSQENRKQPEDTSEEPVEHRSVDAPEEHRAPQLGMLADAESRGNSQSPVDSKDLHPGDPIFRNAFPDETDPRHSILVPYFQIMDRFRALAEEYPDVSALWQADFGRWRVWPLAYRDAKVLSEHIVRSQEVPYSPGADLHLEYNAIHAVERLIIDVGIKQDQLNKILTRDRWLATRGFNASDLWLHSIREFWLGAQENAEASGADLVTFEKVAEEHGYSPETSTAVGRRVWSLMATQHKPLKQIVKEHQLSTGDEIERTEEPAGWVQAGTIKHVFTASVYFCGVLAARRARDLEHSMTTAPADLSANVLYLNPPPFRYQYPDDFPAAGQMAIEHARLEANGHLEKRAIGDFADYIDALTEWSWAVITAAAREIGRAGTKHEWGANRRRDELFNFAREVLLAAGTVGRGRHSFDDFIKSDKWRELDNLLLLVATDVPAALAKHDQNSGDRITQSTTIVRDGRKKSEDRQSAAEGPGTLNPISMEISRGGKRRGRRANLERRKAIHAAISKQGNTWRDHLSEIFAELDTQTVALGDFQGMRIDLGDDQSVIVSKWEDLDLAIGDPRGKIIDVLRKYV